MINIKETDSSYQTVVGFHTYSFDRKGELSY
jgi:hypothetical protein